MIHGGHVFRVEFRHYRELLPPHVRHGSFMSTERQQLAGPMIGNVPVCFLGFRDFAISTPVPRRKRVPARSGPA